MGLQRAEPRPGASASAHPGSEGAHMQGPTLLGNQCRLWAGSGDTRPWAFSQSPLRVSSWSRSSGRALNWSANGPTHLLLPFRGTVLGALSARRRKQWTEARRTGPGQRWKVPKTKGDKELLTSEAKDVALTLGRVLRLSAVPPVNGMITLGGQTLCSWKELYFCCCSVAQSCPTLCDPMDCSRPGFPVLHYLLEFAQTHVH